MPRKGSINWNRLTSKHKVVDKGSHYETGSGKLITWSSFDSRKAQSFLRQKARKRKRRKKR